MRFPLFVLVISVAGLSVFAAGYWVGRENRAVTSDTTGDYGADFTPFSPESPAIEGSGGGSGGGAAIESGPHPAPADLTTLLENPNQRSRERDLEILGARDFATGADWQASAASIGDWVDRGVYLKGVFAAWAADDPIAALAHLSTRSLSERSNLIPHAISVWAERDPATAEPWVLALENGEVRDRAVESLYCAWAVNDPATAAAKSLGLGDESARFRALSAVVKQWSADDLAGVGAWASGLDDPILKDFATMAVADEMSVRAPREAMKWASDHLAKDPEANLGIVPLVASKAGFESPRETFDWLKSVPPSAEAASSLAGVATYLVEENSAFAWEDFPKLPEELKQVTAGSVASTLGSKDPEDGKRWLGQLPDGEMKRFATSAFSAGWATRDPSAAQAWVDTLPAGSEKDAAIEGLSSANPDSGAGSREP